MTMTLRSAHGKFLCVELDGSVVANRDAAGPWETITVEWIDEVSCALKSHHGKYFTGGIDGTVEARQDAIYPWEHWTVRDGETDGSVAFISVHGTALAANPDGRVICMAAEVHAWESWATEPVDWWKIPPAPQHINPLIGRLRIENGCFVDDTGFVLPTFAHAGDLFSQYTRNPSFALQQLEDLVAAGYQGARIWFNLGCGRTDLCPPNHFWSGRECGPNHTANYWDQVGQFLIEMKNRQLTALWSQGDPAQTGGTVDARKSYAQQAANVARQVDGTGYIVAFYDAGNEAWQNDAGDRLYQSGNPDDVKNMAAVVKAYTAAGGTALTTTTSPPSENPADMDRYTPSGVSLWDVHSDRGGHSWDKRRHIFTLPYENGGPKSCRVGVGSEPPGNGALVSASDGKNELDHEAMALLGTMSLIAHTAHVWFSGEGVKLGYETPEGLKAMAGFAAVPAMQRLLPKDVMTYQQLHHSGDTWRNIRVFSLTDAEARMDGSIAADGRFAYICDGKEGRHKYHVDKGFEGSIITPGSEPTVAPLAANAGEQLEIEWKRGRVILGQVR